MGDTTPATQLKLLRALQEQEIMRVGETRPRKVDIRVIAVINRDTKQAVEDGQLGEDLAYRLEVVHIEVPLLRERSEDILPLSNAKGPGQRWESRRPRSGGSRERKYVITYSRLRVLGQCCTSAITQRLASHCCNIFSFWRACEHRSITCWINDLRRSRLPTDKWHTCCTVNQQHLHQGQRLRASEGRHGADRRIVLAG
jgi:hypothetical protein